MISISVASNKGCQTFNSVNDFVGISAMKNCLKAKPASTL